MGSSKHMLAACLVLTGCDDIFDLVEVQTPDASGPLDDGLVAYYPMEDVVNNRTEDLAGRHHAQCAGSSCPEVIAGRQGNALQFQSASQHLMRVADDAAFHTESGYTVSAWLREDSVPSDFGCAVSKIYGFGTENSWQMCFTSGGTVQSYSGGTFLNTGAPAGVWLHVLVRWDGAIKSLWVNGTSLASEPSIANPFDTGVILFGADLETGVPAHFLDGAIDEVRIYNRPLAMSEIAALAAGQ